VNASWSFAAAAAALAVLAAACGRLEQQQVSTSVAVK
jgi:hypothetical protein